MIVRNEAHIIREGLDSVAPYIDSWVIVDTGSDDGTQDVIREHLAGLGIPGELYERPWRDFGHNRTEALMLAQGHGDYIWVMDADDVVVGAPDFTALDADVYFMRVKEQSAFSYWRGALFRDGARVRYVGVVHESVQCDDDPFTTARLAGDHHIESRRLGGRNLDTHKYERDIALLLSAVQRDPTDARSVFYLAQSYFLLTDFANARTWYERRIELGGWNEEVYYSIYRLAMSMERLGEPWPDVEQTYLRAWETRPTRAEAVFTVAVHYRVEGRYQLGYLFARCADEIDYPDLDVVFVHPDIHQWRTTDERAVCASQIGRHSEAFALFRRLVAHPEFPDAERPRMANNRDFSVPAMLAAASSYPEAVVRGLPASRPDSGVTVSVIAGPDRGEVERALNSFLYCCNDIGRAGRFLVVDTGLSVADRGWLGERYGFVEFVDAAPDADPVALLAGIRHRVGGRCWLHLGRGWRFFAPEDYLTRLTAVLDAEPQLVQVGVNFGDAAALTRTCAGEAVVRRAPGAGRYVLGGAVVTGPAMFDTARLDRAGGFTGPGWPAATLDEVLCIRDD
ncbi:glycosyltransferase [[Mycobacterium] crassicus]|uniref:Glycosyltransferase n=1 Tax=[Mycobacterium] crassicus TaxID=2872309 RepID=A0ABU5XIY6_9MYCO|nr:glycosyltransferase [Mycolicibacter sp. MYC098]MEB3022252.1 glycosyltransferase [Mycolicibacter sp. MYC098]